MRPKSCKALHNDTCSSCKMRSVGNLLNNKTIILLNLAKYGLILIVNYQLCLCALQIIKEGKDQDDLNELAKLFDIHKS